MLSSARDKLIPWSVSFVSARYLSWTLDWFCSRAFRVLWVCA